MKPSAYCTGCGAERTGDKPFCTSCGTRYGTRPSTPVAEPLSPRAASRPRALRCVECGSPIDSGLVCARCAGGHSSAAAIPAQAASDAAAPAPSAFVTPPPHQGGWKHHWATKVLAFALLVPAYGIMYVLRADSRAHGHMASDLWHKARTLTIGLDGAYALEERSEYSGTATIVIEGDKATLAPSNGDAETDHVERVGDTIRFVDDIPSFAGGARHGATMEVTLARLVQNGQAIEMDVDGHTLRFVKR